MNEKLERARQHLKSNKQAYISGSLGLMIGAAGTWFVAPQARITVDAWKITLLSWKSPTTNITQVIVAPRGHRGLKVRVNETGQIFGSVRHAAAELGVHRRDIFNHLHGLNPDVKGFTFTNLGENV